MMCITGLCAGCSRLSAHVPAHDVSCRSSMQCAETIPSDYLLGLRTWYIGEVPSYHFETAGVEQLPGRQKKLSKELKAKGIKEPRPLRISILRRQIFPGLEGRGLKAGAGGTLNVPHATTILHAAAFQGRYTSVDNPTWSYTVCGKLVGRKLWCHSSTYSIWRLFFSARARGGKTC